MINGKLMTSGLAVIMASLLTAGQVFAEGATVRQGEFDTTVTNPCNGEQVALHNEFQVVSNTHQDESGGFHSTITLNQQSTGEGLTTGASYHASLESTSSQNISDPENFERTIVVTSLVVSQGGGEDFRSTFHFKVTVANGETKVTFVRVETECTG